MPKGSTRNVINLVEKFNKKYEIELDYDLLENIFGDMTDAVNYLSHLTLYQENPDNTDEVLDEMENGREKLYELYDKKMEETKLRHKASYKEVLKNTLQQRIAVELSPEHKHDENTNAETMVKDFHDLMTKALYFQSNNKNSNIYKFFNPSDIAFGFMTEGEMEEFTEEIKELQVPKIEKFVNEIKVDPFDEFVAEMETVKNVNDVLSNLLNDKSVDKTVSDNGDVKKTDIPQMNEFFKKLTELKSENDKLNDLLNGKSAEDFLKEAEAARMKEFSEAMRAPKNVDELNRLLEDAMPSDTKKNTDERMKEFIGINNRMKEIIRGIKSHQTDTFKNEMEVLKSSNETLIGSLNSKSVDDIVSSVREKYINQNAPYESVISAARIIKAKNDSRKGFWARYFHWIDNLREKSLYNSLVAKAKEINSQNSLGHNVDKDFHTPLPALKNRINQIATIENNIGQIKAVEDKLEPIKNDLDTIYEHVNEVKGDKDSKKDFDNEVMDFIYRQQHKPEKAVIPDNISINLDADITLDDNKTEKENLSRVPIVIEAAAPEEYVVDVVTQSNEPQIEEENLLIG